MTYNFDPEKWLENQEALLVERHRRGELDVAALDKALAELRKKYEAMVARLDGTYQLPKP